MLPDYRSQKTVHMHPRYEPRGGAVRTATVLLCGVLIGALLTLVVLILIRPGPVPSTPAGGGASDITVTIDRELFVRLANERLRSRYEQLHLTHPTWQLFKGNRVVLSARSTLPIIGEDITTHVSMHLAVEHGAVAARIDEVQYGLVGVPGNVVQGLADGLNSQLRKLVSGKPFRVTGVSTSPSGITITLRYTQTERPS